MNSAMQLATLPTEIANQKMDLNTKQAMITSTFANIEIQRVLAENELTNSEMAALTLMWNFYGAEQNQWNTEQLADFENALSGGTSGIQWADILKLMTWDQEQAKIGYQ